MLINRIGERVDITYGERASAMNLIRKYLGLKESDLVSISDGRASQLRRLLEC
ncbi:hypothetical protein [Moritella viscosa]|uniref:hypothetical protein n=1 Tax=Moritella viscosa TaxID=80854 RepID=UPI001587DA48|nr:hypothetical protein [Moritella viscosa]